MSSLVELLDIFDVAPSRPGLFVGGSDGGTRNIVDGSQLLAQAIVAAAKTAERHSVRSAHAVFVRTADPDLPVELAVSVPASGRTFATAQVTVQQGERICALVTVLLDVAQPDLVRHAATPARPSRPGGSIDVEMPLPGRRLRLVDVADPNDPAEVGPPSLDAWVHYDVVPGRDDLAKALVAHFTGHLSISATLRAHEGIGTAQAHRSISTAVMAIGVTFHEPMAWNGWLLYTHDSVHAGAGMSHVRGQVFTEDGRLLASFTQDGMIRAFDRSSAGTHLPAAQRL